ncbi:DUF1014-domain-containing protein [Roridomyces roridus]|uniref:DUF1014-domain-containing protein n=1 Tax=Roridomyces roridus TaxID=1738132 RepID=A0AAD7FC82_9AGAR|nr:DUF1014-domain-containing protein [Roridomyces roridus]
MPPKGGNAKKESGRAKKAENESKKNEAAAAAKEQKEAQAWTDTNVKGGKAKQEDKEEKRRAELARKAENARLLAEEEKAAPANVKVAPKAVKKVEKEKPAGPGAIAAGGGLAADKGKEKADAPKEVESFTATGLDDVLDLLDVVGAKTDKASVGQQAAGIEQHPERRFKAAYEAYQERELPNIRKEHPGLRLQQYKELMFKQFKKSPENPFNQVVVEYDATKEDKVEALKHKQAQVAERLREKSS